MRASSTAELVDGALDDVLVFWKFKDDARRSVITGDYGASRDYLDWLLSRRLGDKSLADAVPYNLGMLAESAGVLTFSLGEHLIGLMRPKLAGDPVTVRAANPPFLICFERKTARQVPEFPVLAASRDSAVALVRNLKRDAGIDTQRWRSYSCERLLPALTRLVNDLAARRPSKDFLTDLERELTASRRPPPRSRRRAA